jgi:hypothetical protein
MKRVLVGLQRGKEVPGPSDLLVGHGLARQLCGVDGDVVSRVAVRVGGCIFIGIDHRATELKNGRERSKASGSQESAQPWRRSRHG